MSLSRRTAGLARTFQIVALAVGAPALAVQCSSTGGAGAGTDASTDPGADATVPGADTGAPSSDGSAKGAADSAVDAADGAISCWASVSALDGGGPDGEELCTFGLPCGLAPSQLTSVGCTVVPMDVDGGPQDAAATGFPKCTILPDSGCNDGSYDPTQGGGVVFTCIGCPAGGGRRPAGLCDERPEAASAVGAYFAEMAWLEEASVRAFLDLASELESHGAPAELVDAARSSAEDEVRHARLMTALARRFGATPRPPRVRPTPRRSLAAMARDNAAEGCVRETYGALVNAWQATHAADPEVRAALASIAQDELRHAALSWEIAAWAQAHVAPGPVARAQRKAAAKLAAAAARPLPRALRDAAGLPDARQATELARGLARHLWAA